MPLSPLVSGDSVDDQWKEEVTYELNNLALAALAGQAGTAAVGEVICPVYAIDAEGNDQSYNLGSRNFVFYLTVSADTDKDTLLPIDETFIQFRGEQTRVVEISIKRIPTAFTNARGQVQDYSNFNTLAVDWSIGAVEVEDFEDDPDGMDFAYRTTSKILYARVMQASQSVDPDDAYADATLSRSFDWRWSRNGETFVPAYSSDVTLDFPFITLTAADVVDAEPTEPGRASQFFCNVVQL